jgi:nitroimidazol reductase NimA-like FMN-containing flavoprotein (pyridoxamine 5'-phosphate oxidase superfamily)
VLESAPLARPGRIAILIDGWPEVFPVNYVAEDGAVAFRRAAGAKLEHGPDSRACFEVDGWDDATGTGWSVMAQGILRDITDAKEEDAGRLASRLCTRRRPASGTTSWLCLLGG